MDSIPQISLGTAALIIFGAIASLAMLRGLLRILWGTLVLCLAGLAAFLSWQHAPVISQEVLGRDLDSRGLALEGDREQCIAAGMDDYVSKPVRRQELYAALEAFFPKD